MLDREKILPWRNAYQIVAMTVHLNYDLEQIWMHHIIIDGKKGSRLTLVITFDDQKWTSVPKSLLELTLFDAYTIKNS